MTDPVPVDPASVHACAPERRRRLAFRSVAGWIGAGAALTGGGLAYAFQVVPAWGAALAVIFLVSACVLCGVSARVASGREVHLHANGIAIGYRGRVIERIFWKDMVNLLEDPRTGRVDVYSHEAHVTVDPREVERGDELREQMRVEWTNLWGYKVSTFPKLAFHYPTVVKTEVAQRLGRAALAPLVPGALMIVAGLVFWGAGWVILVLGAVAFAAGIVLGARARWRVAAEARRIDQLGGIQLDEKGLQVISAQGELRAVGFAEIAEIRGSAGRPVEVVFRTGETMPIYRGLTYFEKFRESLIDAAREAGIRITE